MILTMTVGVRGTVGTSSSETNPTPTTTKQVELVTATAADSSTASATPSPSPTSTVEPTVATVAAPTHQESAVPLREEVRNQGEAPNIKPSENGSQEVLGATLTVYNCVGSTGGNVYCPGGSHTSSGTEVGPGTAACDPSYKGRKFQIVGDKQGLIWTCLDTGEFGGDWFDLWFYNLADGLVYIKNLPDPYQITFVD